MRAVIAVLLFVTAAHAGLWGLLQEKQSAPDFRGILPSVSYSPFEGSAHPDTDNLPSEDKIRADMKKLSTMTKAIRLYSSTGGVELVPPIAAEFGLKVTVGAWIDKDKDRNKREIDSAIKLARRNSNVIGVVVGNETIYRGEQIPLENLDTRDGDRAREKRKSVERSPKSPRAAKAGTACSTRRSTSRATGDLEHLAAS